MRGVLYFNALQFNANFVLFSFFQCSLLASSFAWFFQCLDLYLKIVFLKPFSFLKPWYTAATFVLPLYLPVCMLVFKAAGFSYVTPWCSFGNTNSDLISTPVMKKYSSSLYYRALESLNFVGFVLMAFVTRSILKTHRAVTISMEISGQVNGRTEFEVIVPGNPERPKLTSLSRTNRLIKILSFQITFATVFSFLWFILAIYRAICMANITAVLERYDKWTECIFDNFDGDSEEAFRVCDNHPKHRSSSDFFYMLIPLLLIPGQSFFVCMQYLPSAVTKSYSRSCNYCKKYLLPSTVIPQDASLPKSPNPPHEEARID